MLKFEYFSKCTPETYHWAPSSQISKYATASTEFTADRFLSAWNSLSFNVLISLSLILSLADASVIRGSFNAIAASASAAFCRYEKDLNSTAVSGFATVIHHGSNDFRHQMWNWNVLIDRITRIDIRHNGWQKSARRRTNPQQLVTQIWRRRKVIDSRKKKDSIVTHSL